MVLNNMCCGLLVILYDCANTQLNLTKALKAAADQTPVLTCSKHIQFCNFKESRRDTAGVGKQPFFSIIDIVIYHWERIW